YADRVDLTFGSDQDMEKANRQYVSGWMFDSLGLKPAKGRLLTASEDATPGVHPYAVVSYDYWKRRFARDPEVIGRTFRMGNDLYRIIGVAGDGFTGTEPGTATEIFVPTMMNAGSINSADSFWFRIFVRPRPGLPIEPIREALHATYRAVEQERSKGFGNSSASQIAQYLNSLKVLVQHSAAGVSMLQKNYRVPLAALSALVFLVLLIACTNVANLMTAWAAA